LCNTLVAAGASIVPFGFSSSISPNTSKNIAKTIVQSFAILYFESNFEQPFQVFTSSFQYFARTLTHLLIVHIFSFTPIGFNIA